jgi:hypothetical protein
MRLDSGQPRTFESIGRRADSGPVLPRMLLRAINFPMVTEQPWVLDLKSVGPAYPARYASQKRSGGPGRKARSPVLAVGDPHPEGGVGGIGCAHFCSLRTSIDSPRLKI